MKEGDSIFKQPDGRKYVGDYHIGKQHGHTLVWNQILNLAF